MKSNDELTRRVRVFQLIALSLGIFLLLREVVSTLPSILGALAPFLGDE